MKPRKIPRHSKVMARIHFHSQKNDSTRFCDSELEVARLLLLEFEDDVIAYNTQPASFTYLVNGKIDVIRLISLFHINIKGCISRKLNQKTNSVVKKY